MTPPPPGADGRPSNGRIKNPAMRPLLHGSRLFDSLCGLIFLLLVPLAACDMLAKKQVAVLPPPKPAAAQPPAPEAPLSIPQTGVTLPSPQPVNPDAIPKIQVAQEAPAAVEKPETPAPPKPVRKPAPTQSKQEAETEAETPAPPPAAAPEQPPPIQPILSADDQKRIREAIENRKREITAKLGRAKGPLSAHNKSLIERIRSMLTLCDEAEKRGDYSQADALSERAAALVQELQIE